jgi:hypothetical protein
VAVHLQAAICDRLAVRAPGDQDNVFAMIRQHAAKVPADRTRAHNRDSHYQ